MNPKFTTFHYINTYVTNLQSKVLADINKQYASIYSEHFKETQSNFVYKGKLYRFKLVRECVPLIERLHAQMDLYLQTKDTLAKDSLSLHQYIASLILYAEDEQLMRNMLPDDFASKIIKLNRTSEEPVYTKQQQLTITKINKLIDYYEATNLIY